MTTRGSRWGTTRAVAVVSGVLLLVVAVGAHVATAGAATATATISGRVTGSDGRPVAGATVRARYDSTATWTLWDDPVAGTTVTDASGAYTLGPLPEGRHRVEVIPAVPSSLSTASWNPYEPGRAGAFGAHLSLSADESRAGVDLALPTKGRLLGAAVASDGTILPGITVEMGRAIDPWTGPQESFAVAATTVTDSTGFYDFGPVDLGPWYVRFTAPGGSPYVTQFATGVHDLANQYPRPIVRRNEWLLPPPSREHPVPEVVRTSGAWVEAKMASTELQATVRSPHGVLTDHTLVVAPLVWSIGFPTDPAPNFPDPTHRLVLDTTGRARTSGVLPGLRAIDFEPAIETATSVEVVGAAPDPELESVCRWAFWDTCLGVQLDEVTPIHLRLVPDCGWSPYVDVAIGTPECAPAATAWADHTLGGYQDETFRGEAAATRRAAVLALWRWAGKPAAPDRTSPRFVDVTLPSPTRTAVEWAAANGFVGGYADGRFRPDDAITRQGLALILWRAQGEPETAAPAPFTDLPPSDTSISAAIRWLHDELIAKPTEDGIFGTTAAATRAQLAEWLMWYPELP